MHVALQYFTKKLCAQKGLSSNQLNFGELGSMTKHVQYAVFDINN